MPVIFGCILILIILIRYETKKASKNRKETVRDFLQRELEANTTRKQDISGLPYITIELSCLPDVSGVPDPDGEIAAIFDELRPLDGMKIINLSGISNTDLKLSYGAANFPFLSECDARFTFFTRKLYELGLRLNEAGACDTAVRVLEYAVSIGTDSGSAYRLLGGLYAKQRKNAELGELCEKAQSLPETIRGSVCSFLAGLNSRDSGL